VTVEGTTPTQLRAESFPDLGDELMFPRLSEKKLARLGELGRHRRSHPARRCTSRAARRARSWSSSAAGCEVLDRKPGKDVWVAEADAGTFLGDIATFTGEPAIAECVADEPTDVIAFDALGAARDARGWPEMAELVLRTMMARREWHAAHGLRRAAADRAARLAARLRCARPARAESHPGALVRRRHRPESAAMLDWLQIPRERRRSSCATPSVLRNPSAAQVARELGLRAEIDGERFDLVVLGGGPAGLAAAGLRRVRGPAHARGPRRGRRAARPAPARGSRTTSASPPGSPAAS
jgi:thioredoxin reductase (NADPH)